MTCFIICQTSEIVVYPAHMILLKWSMLAHVFFFFPGHLEMLMNYNILLNILLNYQQAFILFSKHTVAIKEDYFTLYTGKIPQIKYCNLE